MTLAPRSAGLRSRERNENLRTTPDERSGGSPERRRGDFRPVPPARVPEPDIAPFGAMVEADIRTLGHEAIASPNGCRFPSLPAQCTKHRSFPITAAGQLRIRTGFPHGLSAMTQMLCWAPSTDTRYALANERSTPVAKPGIGPDRAPGRAPDRHVATLCAAARMGRSIARCLLPACFSPRLKRDFQFVADNAGRRVHTRHRSWKHDADACRRAAPLKRRDEHRASKLRQAPSNRALPNPIRSNLARCNRIRQGGDRFAIAAIAWQRAAADARMHNGKSFT